MWLPSISKAQGFQESLHAAVVGSRPIDAGAGRALLEFTEAAFDRCRNPACDAFRANLLQRLVALEAAAEWLYGPIQIQPLQHLHQLLPGMSRMNE
jgi:hypothetical protein